MTPAAEMPSRDPVPARRPELAAVVLVGNPNVGKSALFGALTGTYADVSNYPGTTVEVTRARLTVGDHRILVVDTPGAASLVPLSEDERVTRKRKKPPCKLRRPKVPRYLSDMLPIFITLSWMPTGVPMCCRRCLVTIIHRFFKLLNPKDSTWRNVPRAIMAKPCFP